MAEPIRFDYRFETKASVTRTFRAMSDTDQFNAVARGGMSFHYERRSDGSERAVGSVHKLGLTVRWEEEPFRFRAPHWFKTVREFESGPAARLTARAQFAALPQGGTAIAYQLEVVPRISIFRPILMFDLKRTLERNLRAALTAVVSYLDRDADDDPESSIVGPPPALTTREAARLAALAGRLTDPLAVRLTAFLRAAPLRDQLSISPITLAQAWMAPLENVAQLCVDAARVGLLGIRVDLLCPACLVPKAAIDVNGQIPDVHCESCNIRLDASYPESLAVHFFPAPDIRTLDVRTECLSSPARTPHVVAQDVVPAHGSVDLATSLEPGTYQLRTLPLAGPPALLDVRQGDAPAQARFQISGSIQPQLQRVLRDPRNVVVENARDHKIFVALERLTPPRRMLSLGRTLSEYPELGELLPNVGFASSMSSYRGVAAAIRPADPSTLPVLANELAHARLTFVAAFALFATYPDIDAFNLDAPKLDLQHTLVGVARGAVNEATIAGRRAPLGPAVDAAYAAMCRASFGRIERAP